jgi:hypothetical protein
MIDCPACGSTAVAGRHYCRMCGQKLGHFCQACGFFNGLDDAYCGGCGKGLKEQAAGEGKAEAPRAEPPFPLTDDMGLGDDNMDAILSGDGTAGDSGQEGGKVSETEIDNLFENIDEEIKKEEMGASSSSGGDKKEVVDDLDFGE